MKLFIWIVFFILRNGLRILILWLWYRGIVSAFMGHWWLVLAYIFGAIIINFLFYPTVSVNTEYYDYEKVKELYKNKKINE